MQTFKKLLFLLTAHERKNACILLLMIIMMAIIDTIGVASILPFMAVLTNPDIIHTNVILNFMFQNSSIFGVENEQQFLFALGVLVLIILIISQATKALTIYIQETFAEKCQFTIGKRLIEGYLNHNYIWFLNRNSSELAKNILSDSGQVVGNGISPLLNIIARGMVTIAITILLIIADPKLALVVGLSLSSAYVLIFYFTKSYLNLIGKSNLENNKLRFNSISEAFGAIKAIKIGGLEQVYIKLFSKPSKIFHKNQASLKLISQLPRFFLETIAFGGIILIILNIISEKGTFNSAIPIISLYVFAGYRLLPALQEIYISVSRLTYVRPVLDKLLEDFRNIKPILVNQNQNIMSLNESINFKNVDFNYPNTSLKALKNINLSIPAKSTVGFMGVTGSGKTTIVDIILGLLEPQKGSLEVDGKIITKQNLRSWQRSIGYVPQDIYLSDNSIGANIAFGLEDNAIDHEAVQKASKIANIHNFIIDELHDQYQTVVGERGVRLSGGQRQRIGIARALYNNPKILIFDEATSALDNQTEKKIMDSILSLGKEITIILIAHRLNTLKNCNTIFKIDKGEIIGNGTYEEVIK